MKINKKTPYGQYYEEYLYHNSYLNLSKKRSLGIANEMEAAKATAMLIKKSKIKFNSVLDAGCQSGHYLYTLRKRFGNEFSYTGIDGFENHIKAAKKIWQKDQKAKFYKCWIQKINIKASPHDISFSINVFTHLPEINKALKSLNKHTKKLCIIRTPIHEISYKIQQVYNSKWYKHTTVKPINEFDAFGNPRSCNLYNVYSKEFFTHAVKKNFDKCKVTFVKDTFFDAKNINKKEKKSHPTKVMNGMQITDIMIVPNCFVIIEKL